VSAIGQAIQALRDARCCVACNDIEDTRIVLGAAAQDVCVLVVRRGSGYTYKNTRVAPLARRPGVSFRGKAPSYLLLFYPIPIPGTERARPSRRVPEMERGWEAPSSSSDLGGVAGTTGATCSPECLKHSGKSQKHSGKSFRGSDSRGRALPRVPHIAHSGKRCSWRLCRFLPLPREFSYPLGEEIFSV
jgi:hypothetical protein